MSGSYTRRTVLSALGGSIATGTAVYTLTGDSKAVAIQVNSLDVADTVTTVDDTVTALTMDIDGAVQWDSEKQPTKVVLRLEGKATSGEQYHQLQATDWRSDVKKDQSAEFAFTDVDVLQLPNLEASTLTPENVGESKATELELRLTLTVWSGGVLLKEHMVEDRATVNVTKGMPRVNATVSASGNLTVN